MNDEQEKGEEDVQGTNVGNVIYILNGFIKKTQRTPKQEIKKARAIMKGLGL